MTQHTPGPWQIGQVEPSVAYVMRRPYLFITVDCRENFGNAEANARLIAKAPEMLSLLQRIAKEWPDVAEAMTARALLKEIEG